MAIFDKLFKTSILTNSKCYIGNSIPGKNIEKSFGLISQVTKGVDGNVNDKMEKIIESFVNKALEIGGNAIINFRFETGSYQQQSSTWVVSYIIIYGEVVFAE